MPQDNDTPPTPAYFPTSPASPLHPPKALYARLKALKQETGELVKTTEFTIPPRSGRAWKVPAGALFRLSTPDGPQEHTNTYAQVGDLNVFNAANPRERFWAARTRQLQASHVSEGDRLWSCLPFMRPLCGVVEDGCRIEGEVTRWGGRCHDLLGTRCDPYVSHMLTGDEYDYHCHSNLVRALLPYNLTEYDVHDVLNVFQTTGLDPHGRYFMQPSPATPSSFLTFFAEQPLLCALSTCPGGDLSRWGWARSQSREKDDGGEKGDEDAGGGDAMKDTCRPIRVEVFEIAEGVRGEVLGGWSEPAVSGYRGMHGMRVPGGEDG